MTRHTIEGRPAAEANPRLKLDRGVTLEAITVIRARPLVAADPIDSRVLDAPLGAAWRTGSLVHALALGGTGTAAVCTFADIPGADCHWLMVHEATRLAFAAWDGRWQPRAGHGPDAIAAWCQRLQPPPDQPPWPLGAPSTHDHARNKLAFPDPWSDAEPRHRYWTAWLRGRPDLQHRAAAIGDATGADAALALTGVEAASMNQHLQQHEPVGPTGPLRWDPGAARILVPQDHRGPARIPAAVLEAAARLVADAAEDIITTTLSSALPRFTPVTVRPVPAATDRRRTHGR